MKPRNVQIVFPDGEQLEMEASAFSQLYDVFDEIRISKEIPPDSAAHDNKGKLTLLWWRDVGRLLPLNTTVRDLSPDVKAVATIFLKKKEINKDGNSL